MCDNERLYTPYPRNNYRITQLEEMILKQGEMILKQNKKIELLEDKLADKTDVFHIGENVKYKTDIVSITDIQVEDDNIEYYTIKLKEGLERQVFKKDLTKININIETLQQKTNIQKFVFNIINNINRYYLGYGDDDIFTNHMGLRNLMCKTNHLYIYHSQNETILHSQNPLHLHKFIIYGTQFVPIHHHYKIDPKHRTIENDLMQQGLTQLPDGIKICNWNELCDILGIINDRCIPYLYRCVRECSSIMPWGSDSHGIISKIHDAHLNYIKKMNLNKLLFYYHPDYLHISKEGNTTIERAIIQQYLDISGPGISNEHKIFNNPNDVLIKPKKEPNEFRYYTDVKV